MKKIIFITALLLSFRGLSQTKKVIYKDFDNKNYQIGYLDNLGRKDSSWVYYDNKEKITSTAKYKNGVKHGEWIIYHNNGKIAIQMIYSEGVVVSGKRWDENGTLLETKQ